MAIIKSNKRMYLVKYSETSNEIIKGNSFVYHSMNLNLNELPIAVRQNDVSVFDVDATKGKSKNKSATMIQYQLLGAAGGLTKISLNQYQNSLNDITSPFIGELELRHGRLSPREVEICNMIKNGMPSKEIASILNVSVHTIHTQRRNIRKKLRLAGNRKNLTSFLSSNGEA